MEKRMKKLIASLLCCLLTVPLFACNGAGNSGDSNTGSSGGSQEVVGNEIIKDQESLKFAFEVDDQIKDIDNGFTSASDLTGARFNVNG